jgi:putative peptide zinc metalloprotease protein
VVWLPEQATVRAGVDGFVSSVDADPGSRVAAGQALISNTDPALEAQLQQLQARVDELQASYNAEFVADHARSEIVREQLLAEQKALARVRERVASLVVRAGTDGVFTIAAASDLSGRYFRQGEVLGFVLGKEEPVVRVVVEQGEADLVSGATRAVQLRLRDDVGQVFGGRILRQVPAGTDVAPSGALLAAGGGHLASDPRDPQGRKILERVFEIDVALTEPLSRTPAYGQRVFVRFDLQPEPLAGQAWRAVRRLFLRHFDV